MGHPGWPKIPIINTPEMLLLKQEAHGRRRKKKLASPYGISSEDGMPQLIWLIEDLILEVSCHCPASTCTMFIEMEVL